MKVWAPRPTCEEDEDLFHVWISEGGRPRSSSSSQMERMSSGEMARDEAVWVAVECGV
jgi:hypothetical protein